MPVTVQLLCHPIAKRPDWAMKSRTALNINGFVLFGMFGSPCRRVEIFSRFAAVLMSSCDPMKMSGTRIAVHSG